MTGDVTQVQSVWAVLAILVVIAVPQFFIWLNSRQAKHNSRQTKDQLDHEMNPNSGGSLRDAVDRIEVTQAEQGKTQALQSRQIAALQAARRRRFWR